MAVGLTNYQVVKSDDLWVYVSGCGSILRVERTPSGQLELPFAAAVEPNILHLPPRPGELAQLRARLPPTLQFGACGWAYPGWAGLVWSGRRSKADLERSGLSEYAAWPLFTTMYLAAGEEAAASERDLRLYASQLPADMHCLLEVHPDLTTPRFLHASLSGAAKGQAGQANPRFLDSRFFVDEILRVYRAVFGEKLGPFLFTFPPILRRFGITPEIFVSRLTNFFKDLPEEIECAIEVREAEFLTPAYARMLNTFRISHVFTTWAGMPPLTAQAASIPPGPEVLVQVVDPTGKGQSRLRSLEPFDKAQDANQTMREAIVELLLKLRSRPTYVLVHNNFEGSAPLTILALARMLVDRLGK